MTDQSLPSTCQKQSQLSNLSTFLQFPKTTKPDAAFPPSPFPQFRPQTSSSSLRSDSSKGRIVSGGYLMDEISSPPSSLASTMFVAAHRLEDATSWWYEVNDSLVWQDLIFYTLAGLYGIISIVAFVQLIRIECRVPEYGWTTQKVFHFLNFLVNGMRSIVFLIRRDIQFITPEILKHVLIDLPGLAFFTTYALLVLFWAEIYYQAHAVSTDMLRPSFYIINVGIYAIQIAFWVLLWWRPASIMLTCSKVFLAGVSLFAALGFLLYGGRLFLTLRQFPVESNGRRKKLKEVGYVTTICFSCFLIRCIMVCISAFNLAFDLDFLSHPILDFSYYMLVEIVPFSLVLFILRKLPPKRGPAQYHPIHRTSYP